ncbi:MAG: hypothetical protein AAF304_06265, partial [Pseudomonadota bacterium]
MTANDPKRTSSSMVNSVEKFIVLALIAYLCGCANYSDIKPDDHGEDIQYAEDGVFGETVEAKQKRLKREQTWNEKWGTDEKQRLLLIRNIQKDLSLLGYT